MHAPKRARKDEVGAGLQRQPPIVRNPVTEKSDGQRRRLFAPPREQEQENHRKQFIFRKAVAARFRSDKTSEQIIAWVSAAQANEFFKQALQAQSIRELA